MRRPKLRLNQKRIIEIRNTCAMILRNSGITSPPVPVEMIARNLGATVLYAPYEGDNLAGMLFNKDGKSIIAVNSAHHKNRQRFTIAHECGHLILHGSAVFIDRSFEIFRRDDTSSEAIDMNEVEANQFAAELLMPARDVIEEVRKRH